MNAAHPATGATFAFPEVRDRPLHMLLPDLWRLDRLGPANPFVARQRGKAFPLRQCRFVGCQSLFQIWRQFVNCAFRNALFAHAGILRIFRQNYPSNTDVRWTSAPITGFAARSDGEPTLLDRSDTR